MLMSCQPLLRPSAMKRVDVERMNPTDGESAGTVDTDKTDD
jgi:hypothetical protein